MTLTLLLATMILVLMANGVLQRVWDVVMPDWAKIRWGA